MKSAALLATFVYLFSSAAFAQDDEEPVQTQAEMNAEAAAEFKKADAALNAAYKKVMAGQDADGAAKLKAAQKAWLVFRDAQAAFEAASSEGGTIHPMEIAYTKARLTETRTEELEALLDEHSDPDEKASDGAAAPNM